MNRTNYIILKLLSQHSLSAKELIKYIPINNFTLIKNITEINELLESLNLPIIKKERDEYILNLNLNEKEKFFNNCINYSQNQRCNYLILKLFIENKINLEQEKEILNISRSTIKRDLEKIKKFFISNNLTLNSIKWQGIFLEKNNLEKIYVLCCNILIKFYYEYDLLPKELKKYLLIISKNKNKYLIRNLDETFNIFNLKIGDLNLTYLLALDDCIRLFDNFYLEIIEEQFKKLKFLKNFEKIFNSIKKTALYTDKYSKYLSVIIWNTYHNKFPQEEKYASIINSFEKIFYIKLTSQEKYLLTINIFYSQFKFNNHIYTVKKYSYNAIDKKLLKLLEYFFKLSNINLLYGDKLLLLELIKTFFKQRELNNSYNILIIQKEINQKNIKQLEKILSEMYPNFNFTIESYLFFKLDKYIKKEYNLILTDTIFEYKIPYLIDEYLIEVFYSKFK